MQVSWNGSWTGDWLMTTADDLQCGIATYLLFERPSGSPTLNGGFSIGTLPLSGSSVGCIVQAQALNNPGTPATNEVRFLYHFGVLLAADGAAHALASWLPLASPRERALTESSQLAAGCCGLGSGRWDDGV
jgi:hypothetical protein